MKEKLLEAYDLHFVTKSALVGRLAEWGGGNGRWICYSQRSRRFEGKASGSVRFGPKWAFRDKVRIGWAFGQKGAQMADGYASPNVLKRCKSKEKPKLAGMLPKKGPNGPASNSITIPSRVYLKEIVETIRY